MLKPSIRNPVQAPIAAEPSHRISQATISRLRPSLSNTQASPSHNGQEARSPATQVELYRLCLLIEVKQTAMLRCGNTCFCEGFRMPAASNRATNAGGRRTKTAKGRNRDLGDGRAASGHVLSYGDL